MKRNLLTKGILITVMSLALASMTACSNNNSEVEEPTEEELPTVSATVEPSTPPVQKGQVMNCSYNAGGTLHFFRFIYAEGEQ